MSDGLIVLSLCAICFVLGSGAGIKISSGGLEGSLLYECAQAVEQCEADLPRNKFCKPSAVVKE